MSDEIVKLLVGTGVGGVIGCISIWLWWVFRGDHRVDLEKLREQHRVDMAAMAVAFQAALAEMRESHRDALDELRAEVRDGLAELRDGLANLPGWLQAIHSRLSGLGADSIAPPVAVALPPRRRHQPAGRLPRLQTAPTGVPVTGKPPDEGDGP